MRTSTERIMAVDFAMPPRAHFIEVPGLRGLRLARIGQAEGKTLEVVEAVKGVIIPAMTHPSKERGRVLSGSLRFMRDGQIQELHAGDEWEVPAGAHQGPHVVLDNDTRVVILRDGKSAFDVQ
jgi:quercetin dioxygenase-like cupin family protein